tara:strand:- start:255 stop:464 length:210 start_codon:yes stop_codon:yes gene_type:complete
MKTIILALLSISILGCSTESVPVVDTRHEEISNIEIQRKLLQLIITLENEGSEVRTIDFESLGLKPYSN